MKKSSILVVDDEPLNFDVLEALLDEEGYELHYASSGREALEGLVIFNPDLVLLDVMMPDLDGIEVCRRIKAMPGWQMVPIVMVTALSEKEDLARCLGEGANDFLTKPVNPLELRARVQSMLRIKQQYDTIKSLSQHQAATIDLLSSSLNELRSNVISSLPHELNTPLNGISGIIDLLLDHRLGMGDEEIGEFLGLAKQSANRLEKLIHRYLVYLQLDTLCDDENGTLNHIIYPVCIDSRLFFEYCAKEQSTMFHRHDDLNCALQEATILAYPMDLKFIFGELLENAFKFSMLGTPVKISSEIIDKHLLLKIIDQGRGMTEEQVKKIGAFMQFDRSHYEQQGIGLGLEIVKKLTQSRGWTFSISSIADLGTTVSIELPLAAGPK